MRICTGVLFAMVIACSALAQQPGGRVGQAEKTAKPPAQSQLKAAMEANVRAEWEAFKKHDKNAYAAMLADDFAGIEEDGQGMRTKYAATNEIDRSVVSNYFLNALSVMALGPDAAFVTYEITMEFPPKSQVRLKRVLVCELWVKSHGQWKMRYYQETGAR